MSMKLSFALVSYNEKEVPVFVLMDHGTNLMCVERKYYENNGYEQTQVFWVKRENLIKWVD